MRRHLIWELVRSKMTTSSGIRARSSALSCTILLLSACLTSLQRSIETCGGHLQSESQPQVSESEADGKMAHKRHRGASWNRESAHVSILERSRLVIRPTGSLCPGSRLVIRLCPAGSLANLSLSRSPPANLADVCTGQQQFLVTACYWRCGKSTRLPSAPP